MKRVLWCAWAALLWAACSSSPNTENSKTSEAVKDTTAADGEWTSLIVGNSLEGWHSWGKSAAGKAWKVEDGAITLDTSNKAEWQTTDGGDLVTNDEYEDFHLKLEWKLSEGGNSGIIFYVHEDTTQYPYTWSTGMEMQVLHNEGHPDGKIVKHRAGDLYDLITATPESVKPVGEWNQVEIISQGGKLDFIMNGNKVVSTTLWDDNWKQLVAGSKFKDMPGFGTYKKGKIALQDHGDPVWFRNIQIKRI